MAGKGAVVGGEVRVWRITGLCLLYVLQGIPWGLVTGSMPFMLREAGGSYRAVGLLSLATYPYALKVLFAPIVDAYGARAALGRRRSWVLPLGLLAGLHSIWLGSGRVDALVAAAGAAGGAGDGAAAELAMLLGSLVLIFAVQDVAVDAWALWLLRGPRNAPFASTAQTVGLSVGNGLGFPLLLALRRSVRGVSAGAVLFWAGVADLLVVSSVALWQRHDDYGPGRDELGHPSTTVAGQARQAEEQGAEQEEECRAVSAAPSVSAREALSCVVALLRLPHMRWLTLLLLLWPLVVVSVDTAVPLVFLSLGVREEHLAAALAAQAPLQVVLSTAVALRISRGTHPLTTWRSGYRAALAAACLFPGLLAAAHCLSASVLPPWDADPGAWDAAVRTAIVTNPLFLTTAFGVLTLNNYANKAAATSMGAFFNSIVDLRVGATHVTLLNTVMNLGRLWPKYFCLDATERFGYFATGASCAVLGFALLPLLTALCDRLARTEPADWRVAFIGQEKKTN